MKDLIFEGVVDNSRLKSFHLVIAKFNEKPIVVGEGFEAQVYAPNTVFLRRVDYTRVDDGDLFKMTVRLDFRPQRRCLGVIDEASPGSVEEFPIYDTVDFSSILEGLEGRQV